MNTAQEPTRQAVSARMDRVHRLRKIQMALLDSSKDQLLAAELGPDECSAEAVVMFIRRPFDTERSRIVIDAHRLLTGLAAP